MIPKKRITIFSGHYGSGKTNIAVRAAVAAREVYPKVAIADIDIVNPYFRTKDSEQLLEDLGIRLICSPYANSNVDIPALPQDIYAVTDDKTTRFILDVGGDERGALALGRITPAILEENDYDMICVINRYRPLTKDIELTLGVMAEIEAAAGLKFTALVNNSNLGRETTREDIRSSYAYADAVAAATKLPLIYTTVPDFLYPEMQEEGRKLLPLTLQKKI